MIMTDEISYSNNSAYIPLHKHRRRMIRMAVIIGVIVLAAACFIAFFIFNVHSKGRFALREAKNIRLALVATDIELYPAGNSIYAPERASGLAPGVMDSVKRLADVNGEVMLSMYDKNSREIIRLSYKTSDYLVTYDKSESGKEAWTVCYMWKILDY